jgi:CRISPR-associated protein Csc1
MNIYECQITLHENTFFSSREVNNFYQTEALIGNYALSYAFRFVNAPYNATKVMYREHLSTLNAKGLYVTPAKVLDKASFAISQFNATSETYWSRVEQNAITTDVNAKIGKANKARAANLPQIGFLKMLGIGSNFRCYVLSQEELNLPNYIRLGKFMSKAKVKVVHHWSDIRQSEHEHTFTSHTLLNPVDLSPETSLGIYDLYSIHPVPLIDHARLTSHVYELNKEVYLPVGMRYGVEGLPA